MSTRMSLVLAATLAVVLHVTVVRSAQTDVVAEHLAAARAAAGDHHTRLLDFLCAEPEPPRSRLAGVTARPTPGVAEWHAEPAKVFDNLYFLGTTSLNAYAVTTSGGIVVIDPLYDYQVEDEVVGGLRKLGLDPADITHVVVSHGHGDHYGGARYLQQRYGADVLLAAPDWDLMLGNTRSAQAKPDRGGVVNDGQELQVGDTRIIFTLTPGHTPGTVSTLVPVRDGGRVHVAALWGGTAMRPPVAETYQQFAASARKFRAIAEAAGADVIISNHDRFDEAHQKIAMLATRGTDEPHPYVLGSDATLDYFDVVERCALAGLARATGSPQ